MRSTRARSRAAATQVLFKSPPWEWLDDGRPMAKWVMSEEIIPRYETRSLCVARTVPVRTEDDLAALMRLRKLIELNVSHVSIDIDLAPLADECLGRRDLAHRPSISGLA